MSSKPHGEPLRPVWKGLLRFSLVSFPVKAINAKTSTQKVDFHWLHRDCLSRIKYKKVCPIHGEVSEDEIVSGRKIDAQHYVPVEKEEVAALRPEPEAAIQVDVFIHQEALDPLFLGETTYYLIPDGEAAAKPYAVFQRSMLQAQCAGIAQVVLFRKERLVLVRPMDDLLVMTTLRYETELRSTQAVEDELPDVKTSAKEIALARHLIDASLEEKFEHGRYHDQFTEKLQALIERKSKGQKFRIPEDDSPPVSLDFTQALKKSLAQAKKKKSSTRAVKAPAKPRQRKVS